MKQLVVLTGAGVSAESGLKTFRDSDGLWENHRVEDVATDEAWRRNPALVLRFYNERRRALAAAKPNAAHEIIADLQRDFDVQVITQNVDNLHERAGSKKVLHLHGELTKARSTADEALVYEIGYRDIEPEDRCETGSPLRPHIVWFGEAVPLMEEAARLASGAQVLLIVGTSLVVYPAAGLVSEVPRDTPIYVVDPKRPAAMLSRRAVYIEEAATVGMRRAAALLRGA